MKKMCGCASVLLAAVLSLIPVSPGAAAQETDQLESEKAISFGAEADLNSSYIWRGIRFNEGFLVQPSAWISSSGFTFTAWANVVADEKDPEVETGLNEIDLILEYSLMAGSVEIVPSFTYYHYPEDQSCNTGELAMRAVLPVGPASLATDQIFDVMEYEGAYFGDVGIEYEREISSVVSFSSYLYLRWASAKFNESYLGLSESALNETDLGVSFPCYVTEKLYLTPHVELNYILDEDLSDYLDDNPYNVGLKIGCEF
jgi:hypothetical protein